jgi:RNA-directed DNA polymerase
VNHYKRFALPKKAGGTRTISAPMYKLKDVQHWVLENILAKVPVHEAAHGFVAGRSIISNAVPHVQAAVVVNFDLKDFFPSINLKRVKGVYRHLGYSEAVATVLALICTEADVAEAILDGEKWFIGNDERHLPQGAPTSPALTNILCRKLDKRLQGLATKLGFTYTRYADDLSFSTTQTKDINALQQCLHKIVAEEGFTVHPDKTRIMRPGAKKEVTGITVNTRPAVDRKSLKNFRAALHRLQNGEVATAHWGKGVHLIASMEGYVNYVMMVDKDKGTKLKNQFAQVKAALPQLDQPQPRKTYPQRRPITVLPEAAMPDGAIAETRTPEKEQEKGSWWKFWKR